MRIYNNCLSSQATAYSVNIHAVWCDILLSMGRILAGILLCSSIAVMVGCGNEAGNSTGQSMHTRYQQTTNDALRQWCADCHAPPLPSAHPSTEWPSIVLRMQNHRVVDGLEPIPKQELDRIITYLQTRSN